jgi:hypothetical protein
MARKRTRITIDDKIEAQKLVVSRAKDKYDAAVDELERLYKLRDEEHRKDILKRLATSKRTYEEIIKFLEAEPEKND